MTAGDERWCFQKLDIIPTSSLNAEIFRVSFAMCFAGYLVLHEARTFRNGMDLNHIPHGSPFPL